LAKGFNLIFKMSVALHGKQAQESSVLIDTTVQEKNITHKHQARVMNRFCSYLWVVVLIPVGRTRSLFDKFQTGCVWADAKLAIKIINRLNKLAKRHGIQQRRTYVKEVKNCRLSIRHFRHVTWHIV
jgi:IS5 family transposase